MIDDCQIVMKCTHFVDYVFSCECFLRLALSQSSKLATLFLSPAPVRTTTRRTHVLITLPMASAFYGMAHSKTGNVTCKKPPLMSWCYCLSHRTKGLLKLLSLPK